MEQDAKAVNFNIAYRGTYAKEQWKDSEGCQKNNNNKKTSIKCINDCCQVYMKTYDLTVNFTFSLIASSILFKNLPWNKHHEQSQ